MAHQSGSCFGAVCGVSCRPTATDPLPSTWVPNAQYISSPLDFIQRTISKTLQNKVQQNQVHIPWDIRHVLTSSSLPTLMRGSNWQWGVRMMYNTIYISCWQPRGRHNRPSQWEMALLCNDVSHKLGASLESALQNMTNWLWCRLHVLQMNSTK